MQGSLLSTRDTKINEMCLISIGYKLMIEKNINREMYKEL